MNLYVDLETARAVTTPSATMRTLASPTTEPAMPVAVWRTELPAGATGPTHVIDRDQLVVVVSGTVALRVAGVDHRAEAGAAVKLPAGAERVIGAVGDQPAVTITVGQPDARATVGDNDPVPVPWTA